MIPLRKGMRSNVFDNMLNMMEKYANNLETLVDERTHLLHEEKRKTDDLLHLMLPKPVAEQLKYVRYRYFMNSKCIEKVYKYQFTYREIQLKLKVLTVSPFSFLILLDSLSCALHQPLLKWLTS